MLAVSVLKPGTVGLVEVPKPVPGPYQALVRTEVASLCNANDRKLVEGHFPGVEDYPLLLGHESAGIVEAVGEKVRSFKAGDRVIGGLLLDPPDRNYASGWGGFSEYTLAGDHHAMIEDGVATSAHSWYEVYEIMRAVPQWLPVEAAVLLCTWREVYAGFGDFNLRAGDDILIFGAGPVGLSFVKFARLLGLSYIGLVDLVSEKRQKALEMGADAVFAPDAPELLRLIKDRGKPLDAVVDAVGKEGIINSALPLIRMAGSVCVYGVIDTPTVTLEKTRGPYNFNLLIHQWPTRSREAAAQEPLCEWVAAGKLSHTEFVSAEFPIGRIDEALEFAKSGRPLKTLLRF